MSLRFSVAICIFDLIGCNYKTIQEQEQEQEVSVSRIRQCCLNSRQISFWCCTRYDASNEKPPWCKIHIVYVIESAAYGVIYTSCLCQKPERAREGF